MPHLVSLNLNKKLLIFVLSISLIALSITTILSFNFADAILKDDIKNQLVVDSAERGHAVKSLLKNRIQQTKNLANHPLILESIVELNGITDEQVFNLKLVETDVLLTVEIRNYQLGEGLSMGLEDVQIIGREGRIFYSLNEHNERGKFLDDSRLNNIVAPKIDFIPDENEKKMQIIFPIFESGDAPEYLGSILVTTNTEAIDRILSNRIGLEETGEVYLVNERNLMISDSIFVENAAFNQKVNTPPITECFENGQTFSGIYKGYRGVNILGTSYCELALGFVLLTEMEESEVLKPLYELQQLIIILGIALMIGVIIVTYFLSKRLSEPLAKLSDAANQIAKGNFDVRTNIKTSDEIGQLSSSFDTMAKNLKESMIAVNLREEIIKEQEDILLRFSQKNEISCVCLVDIVQSTVLCADLSNEQTSRFYEIFLNSIAIIVEKFNGIVVKNIGDALLFYFPKIDSKDEAAFKNVIECCLAICEANKDINNEMIEAGLPKISYRVSVTYGTVNIAKVVTSSVDDIFGPTINRCSKINRFALPNNVIIGSDIYENLKSLNTYNFRNMNVNPVGTNAIYTVYLVTRK